VGALPPRLGALLGTVDLAVVFTPREPAALLSRFIAAGTPHAVWIPSFQAEGAEPVAQVQARRGTLLGLDYTPEPVRLALDPQAAADAAAALPGRGPWLALAPGSGNPLKNWPLSHYFEVSRALAWEFKLEVVWFAGPAEHAWLPYLGALAGAQGQVLAAGFPLPTVAALLARALLYVGNDSGLTHLAAAAGVRRVLALFGPTSPRIWAPPGEQVSVLQAPCQDAPCAQGREISCVRARCLEQLSPHQVFEAAAQLVRAG
jgi:ADP-heptose:LPS heptosyltransferase